MLVIPKTGYIITRQYRTLQKFQEKTNVFLPHFQGRDGSEKTYGLYALENVVNDPLALHDTVAQSENECNASSVPCRTASTGRHRRCQRLTDVAPATASTRLIAGGGGRPEREVVGEGRQRTHDHHVVAQQPFASTQRTVDLRQEEVSAFNGKAQSFHHVLDLETIRRRVLVSADTEYVPVQSASCIVKSFPMTCKS